MCAPAQLNFTAGWVSNAASLFTAHQIREADAALTGEAKFGRLVDRDGHKVLAVDVGPAAATP